MTRPGVGPASAQAKRFGDHIAGVMRCEFDLGDSVDVSSWSEAIGVKIDRVHEYRHGRYRFSAGKHLIELPADPSEPLTRLIFCHELAHLALEYHRSVVDARRRLDTPSLRIMGDLPPGSQREEYACDVIAYALLVGQLDHRDADMTLAWLRETARRWRISPLELALVRASNGDVRFAYVECVRSRSGRWMVDQIVAPTLSRFKVGKTVLLDRIGARPDGRITVLGDGDTWQGRAQLAGWDSERLRILLRI